MNTVEAREGLLVSLLVVVPARQLIKSRAGINISTQIKNCLRRFGKKQVI
jgi:hypothetical protein